MCWMNLWEMNHFLHKLTLVETLVNQKIIFLVHSSMATLTSSLENFESSSKSSRVVSVPSLSRWPVTMSVMHTNRVDLLFITLNTGWCTNIISEKPSLRLDVVSKEWIRGKGLSDTAQ